MQLYGVGKVRSHVGMSSNQVPGIAGGDHRMSKYINGTDDEVQKFAWISNRILSSDKNRMQSWKVEAFVRSFSASLLWKDESMLWIRFFASSQFRYNYVRTGFSKERGDRIPKLRTWIFLKVFWILLWPRLNGNPKSQKRRRFDRRKLGVSDHRRGWRSMAALLAILSSSWLNGSYFAGGLRTIVSSIWSRKLYLKDLTVFSKGCDVWFKFTALYSKRGR